MEHLSAAIIFSLSIIFIIILANALIQKNMDDIVTKVDEGSVEMQLRDLLKKYPKSEIYVCDTSQSEESRQILEKLSKDYPQIHIRE